MAQNPGQDPQIPLTLFAGQVTNIDPVALPAGASPDCSDMQFLPAGTASRPCLQKVFATPLGAVTVTYGKSYVDPAGTIRNIYLDSAGNLWVENVTAGTVPTVIATTTPGSYARSITAFGREYIAISDGYHGTEVPLQLSYDSAGNPQLNRVTQDGPGSPPTIVSLALPSVDVLHSISAPATLTISSIFPDQRIGNATSPFSTLNIYVTSGTATAPVGTTVTISGTGTGFDGGTYNVILNPGPQGAITVSAYFPNGTAPYTGAGTLTIGTGVANTVITRVANVVTVQTNTPHQLLPGYQQQLAGVAAGVVGGSISSVKINNENLPGIATVTTASAHGLIPGLNVSLSGIIAASVGTSILSITRSGQIVTVIMSAATGLSPGGIVTISAVPSGNFNTTTQIINVITTTVPGDTFTYAQVDVDASDSSGTGTIALNWPIPNTPTPSFFQVQSAPTPTTFQISINYPDGSWTGGSVLYAWNGTFFVQTVPTATSFTYQQSGPDATVVYASGQTVTPFGQAAPGNKKMQVSYLTDQGAITAPSPPVPFVSNGGQYYSVSNIPIGPANIVARIIEFTGAEGAYFFYISNPPQENGQLVGTATQINDNTTTSAIFDFGDPTLFRSIGISTQGNNLANQVVIEGSLAFGYYGSRLMTWGQRNVVDNLLNLGFDGGYLPSTLSVTNPNGLPTGWNYSSAGGNLAAGHYGNAWQIVTVAGAGNKGVLTQSLYEDYTGAPVARPNTKYRLRVWLQPTVATADLTFTVSMTSAAFPAGNITATISGVDMSTSGSFVEAVFSANTPAVIPTDYTLSVYASSFTTSPTLLIDEINLIYADSPYLNNLIGSYVNNPEGFDGVSGPFGPVDDTHPVMDVGIIRDNLYMLTLDPGGRLHETSQGITEPADWVVNEVAANCGTVSAFSLTRSQADDSSAAGGEEWFSWMSWTGYRIFGGEQPDKISQEIQRPPGLTFPGAPVDLGAINPASLRTVWSMNDPANKIIYLGIPSGSVGPNAAPSVIWQLNYLGLDSASAIVANPPVHKALSGKLVATDMGRKWSPWKLAINGAALMYRSAGNLQTVLFNGNGAAPNTGVGSQFGNVYTLNPNYYTDDDYGLVSPYYVTYGVPDRDSEQQFQLGGGLKMLTYLQAFFSGVGNMNWSVLYNSLANLWVNPGVYLMQVSPLRNAEWPSCQATGQRFFIKFASSPNPAGATAHPATDNAFSLSALVIGMKVNARMKVAGSYP